MFKWLLFVVVTFSMLSCEKVTDPSQVKVEATTSSESLKNTQAKKSLEVTIEFEAAPNEDDRPEASEEVLILNLNLPDDFIGPVDTTFKRPTVLPNLFDVEKKERKLSVGGSLITDPSSEDYGDFVKGAEIKVEIKTN